MQGPAEICALRRTRRALSECKHILVVGAGIGGLSAALALQRYGFRVSVYEQADVLKELGAGVVLTPNAVHGLNFLGIGHEVARCASVSEGHEYRHYRTDKLLQRRPSTDTAAYGACAYYVHRADLQSALLAAVTRNDPDCVHLGHTFAGFSQDADCVSVRFTNGAAVEGDALIGADGIRSAVREALHGHEPVVFMRQVAFRALIPNTRLPHCYEYRRCMRVGPRRLFLSYPLRKNALLNVIAIAQQDAWQEESWAVPAEQAELLKLYEDFAASVRALINAIAPGTLFKWGLHDRSPLEGWSQGRTTLLGDAAHPMSPFLGQGAALAIEDGVILGRCFAETRSAPEATALYERTRRRRANSAQRHSRIRADALQGTLVKNFDAHRDASDTGLLNTLFAYNPATASLEEEALEVEP